MESEKCCGGRVVLGWSRVRSCAALTGLFHGAVPMLSNGCWSGLEGVGCSTVVGNTIPKPHPAWLALMPEADGCGATLTRAISIWAGWPGWAIISSLWLWLFGLATRPVDLMAGSTLSEMSLSSTL